MSGKDGETLSIQEIEKQVGTMKDKTLLTAATD